MVQVRDELFTRREPNLVLVEPHSLVITGLYAAPDRDAETWGCALLLTQNRQVQIRGLAEDGCIPYAASCREAGLDAAIQKDVWHPLADMRQVVKDVEREAVQAMTAAQRLEKRLGKQWDEAVLAEWAVTSERADQLLEQSAQLRFWRGKASSVGEKCANAEETLAQTCIHFGPKPVLAAAPDESAQIACIVEYIRRQVRILRLPTGAAAILCPSNALAEKAATLCVKHGLPARYMRSRELKLEVPEPKSKC
jgi:hypothetical protein